MVRRSSMLDDLAIGQPVVRVGDAERLVGRIAGLMSTPAGMLYEVEFASVIAKALLSDELKPALACDIEVALAEVASGAWVSNTIPESSQNMAREAFVRAQYAAMLKELLAWEGLPRAGHNGESPSRYAMGDSVAIRDEASWLLGVVTGIRWRAQVATYAVETMDGLQTRGEDELAALDEVSCKHAHHALGARVRYLVAGHEHDDDYVGVVCALQEDGPDVRYALQFDDGDIFEGLSEHEIVQA